MLDESIARERDQRHALQLILEHAPVGIWRLDAQRRMRFINAVFCHAVGVEEQRFLEAEHYLTVLPEEVSNSCMASDEHCFSSKETVTNREQIPCVDGKVHTFEIIKTPILDAQGDMQGLVGMAMDITGRLEAERHLSESREKYRALFEGSHAAIMLLDNGRFIDCNPAALTMFGSSSIEELICFYPGQLSPELQADGSDSMAAANARMATALEQGSHQFEWLHRRMDGAVFPAEVLLTPITIGGRIVMQAIVTDISERVQAAEEKLHMQRQLEHTQRLESLGVLTGGIAHDFNNLLTTIMGNAALGRMKVKDTDPAMTHLTHIEEASQQAADLCKQMLAYSGKGRIAMKSINLSVMVESIAKLLDVSIAGNVKLEFQMTENLPDIEADSVQLQQVIMNLVINASDAVGSKDGVISLSTGIMQVDTDYLHVIYTSGKIEPGKFVFLEVADTGCGMDRETQGKIFDPFFTTKLTGRGLGMSAVLGIIHGHHGAIRVCSTLGQGTTFRALFPVPETGGNALPEHDTRHEMVKRP